MNIRNGSAISNFRVFGVFRGQIYIYNELDSGTPLRSVPDLPSPEVVIGVYLPDPQAVPPANALDSSLGRNGK